jgi:hypothetical protein
MFKKSLMEGFRSVSVLLFVYVIVSAPFTVRSGGIAVIVMA